MNTLVMFTIARLRHRLKVGYNMWKNANFRMAVGILAAILMTVVFVFELRIGFNIFERKMLADTDELTLISKQAGSASVSIDTPATYEEISGVDPEGDIIRLKDSDLKLQINGTYTDTDRDSYGIYKYAQSETKQAMTLTVEHHQQDFEAMEEAYNAYIYGDRMALANAASIALEESAAKFMIQTYREGNIPFVYSEGTKTYTAFVPQEDEFIVISAKDPFYVSSGKVSVHYGDPSQDPQLLHTYSDYEELASINQIRMLLETKVKDENGVLDDIESPYKSSGVVGTADTYTSRADNATRAQLVSYADYKWEENGTATGTSMMIDTTSVRAKQSEWVLTSTVYSYSYAGLQLLNLSGQRTSSNLTISGSIMNELESERPYVIVVKYIGESDNLLGLTVIDCREEPLAASAHTEFSTSVQATDVKIEDVVAVQFDIY